MNRIAFASLWFYVFTIPWERSLQLGGDVGSIGRASGFVALGLGLWAVCMRGQMRRLGGFHILARVFLFQVTATIFWTADPNETPHSIRVYYQSMWVLWLIWEFARDKHSLSQLRLAFVLGECVLVLLTIQRFLNANIVSRAKEVRFTAKGWDFNDMAVMVALGVPFACYVAVRSEKLWQRWLGLTCLVLSLIGVLLTASRTGLLGMMLGLLTLPLLQPRSTARTKLFAVPLLAGTVYAASIWLPAQIFTRLGTTLSELSFGGGNDREAIWRVGLLAFPQHWWLGVGAGAWAAGTGNFFAPHNTFLEILLEEGVLGFAVFFSMLAFVVMAVFRSRGMDRRVSAMMLATFLICVIAITWAQLPGTWFVLGWIVAQGQAKGTAADWAEAGEIRELLPATAGAAARSA
jgi:hypothetical protein